MGERVIAIGDIHGCLAALDAVIEAIGLQPDDIVVPVGDYVDRGPDSRGVLDRLVGLGDRCRLKPLLGNHEEMMLAVVADGESPQYWLQYGGVDTLDSYGFSGDLSVVPPDHVEFLKGCLDFFQTASHFFIHANYESEIPLTDQPVRTARWMTLEEQIPGPHFSGKTAVVGHTPDKTGEIFTLQHLKCIDTYCYGGGWLTAMDVASGEVWQADMDGNLR